MDSKNLAAAVVAVAVGVAGGYIKGHHDAGQAATVETQAKRIRDLVAERDESDRIARQQQGIAKDANQQRTTALADAFAARAAAGSLQQRVDQLVAAARHPAASAGSPATGDALDLLADVLGRTDEAAGEFARIADERGIAGRQCERDYDALTAVAR
ncbi:DUF2514 family protein [Burkholderia ambifaria]|uniref:DUF2514 family protein n=1 Tax=Burkholderia ambifaria TaxID=152480 RepID=UPI00158D100B|nr:DUF2514 family protein [Burkholderia ambifaria]